MNRQRLTTDVNIDLCTKYRPSSWEEIIGHKAVVASLRTVVEARDKHSFLLVGDPGLGKTTLARLVSKYLGCKPQDYKEIDAASYTGIDSTRAVVESTSYVPLGGGLLVLTVDECHALSKQAWQSLLKAVEEPPSHVFWILCTTDPAKVPDTFKGQRCATYSLKPIRTDEIIAHLERVARAEGIGRDWQGDVIGLIARQSNGSPRRALTYLAQCSAIRTIDEAAELIKGYAESGGDIELARLMAKGQLTWSRAAPILRTLEDSDAEGVRCRIVAYFNTIIATAQTEDVAGKAIQIVSNFLQPYHGSNKLAELYRDLAMIIWGGK